MPYTILVYDAGERRNIAALKVCRRYLHWVQNSVFEGHLSIAQRRLLKADLAQVLREQDSVIVYTVNGSSEREVWGTEYGHTDSLL